MTIKNDLQNDHLLQRWESPAPPVTLKVSGTACSSEPTSSTAILTTVYTKYSDYTIVVIGSWCSQAATVSVNVDWDELGLSSSTATASVPAIPGLQEAAASLDLAKVNIKASSGLVFLLK